MYTYTLIHRHRIIHWLSVCYVQNKMNFYLYCSVKTITLRKDVCVLSLIFTHVGAQRFFCSLEALRGPGLLILQGCLLSRADKTKYLCFIQNAESETLGYLVGDNFAVNGGRLQSNFPEGLFKTLQSLDHYPSLGDMSHVF